MESEEQRSERLKKFVQDYVEGRLFTQWQCPKDDTLELMRTFMPLLVVDPNDLPAGAYFVYEELELATAWMSADRPRFSSCRFLNKTDTEAVRAAINVLLARRREQDTENRQALEALKL